jgi:ADP-ribosylglycohydrolase
MPSRDERITGGLLGLLIGDALGVPYEFHPPEAIPPAVEIEFTPPEWFRRAHAGLPPGTWSDDGAQALALLVSLLDCGKFDAEDFGQNLLAWHDNGYLAVDGRVFDVGIQTGEAIRALRAGSPALAAGGTHERANGNGSLMRVLPLALSHQGTDAELVADAHAQSRVTHGHLRAQVCCALYCLWARRVLEERPSPWEEALAALRDIYGANSAARAELDCHIRPLHEAPVSGSGYVVDCLRSARWACEQGDYERVVKAAISLGRDTDTTACVAGGIAGLRAGVNAIPLRWREALRGKEIVLPLLERLLAHA